MGQPPTTPAFHYGSGGAKSLDAGSFHCHDDDVVRSAPALASWAEVDPARYPFDPAGVPELVRTTVPPPPPRPVWRDGTSVGGPEAWAWVDAVGAALSERYGPWAYHWHWAPGEVQLVTHRLPAPAEAPAFVADAVLDWRRWLESVAERFDRFRPSLGRRGGTSAGPVEAVAAWEAAIAQVMTPARAPAVDDGGWQGWSCRVLQWFLTDAGVPVEEARRLVESAVDGRFDDWGPPTATVVGEVAERLARDVLGLAGTAPAALADNWPDTWPQGWPSWRATNTGWAVGDPPDRR